VPPTRGARGQRTAPPETIPVLSHGDRDARVIELTIDDCFSAAAVRADLAILEADHVNATWFPIGRNVAASPALWRSIAVAGFPVANHTETHPILTELSYAAVLAEIRDDSATVAALIGEPVVPFLRPPGGAYDATVLAAAEAAGERALVLWDTSDGDTERPYGDVPLLAYRGEQGRDGSILLMHANLPYAQQALPALIAWYRARGFTFVTLGQLFGVPGPVPFPPPSGAPAPPLAPRPSPRLA
jgi:peptidoglycan/xylan/chitin deacetylase (PgdA/CDA1 family)